MLNVLNCIEISQEFVRLTGVCGDYDKPGCRKMKIS
jgi:hypothetical protein